MSLKVYTELVQRSPEWYAARCGIVTASVVGRLVTPKTVKVASNDDSRVLAASLAAERITGYVEETYVNGDMIRGIESEPFARAKYAETKGVEVTEVGFMVRDFGSFKIGFSPDGLVGADGCIEVKSPRQKGHLTTILDDSVPLGYMAQIQCGLLVSGREWCDYVSFNGGMPLWTKRVLPDPRWQAVIVEAVASTENAIRQMVDHFAEASADLPTTDRIDFEVVI